MSALASSCLSASIYISDTLTKLSKLFVLRVIFILRFQKILFSAELNLEVLCKSLRKSNVIDSNQFILTFLISITNCYVIIVLYTATNDVIRNDT